MSLRTYLKLLSLLLALTALGTIVLVPSTYAQDMWGGRSARSDAVTTRLADGTSIAEYPDRTVVIRFANLLRMTITPDDQVTVSGTDSAITKTRLTMQRGEMSDGTMISPMANGALRIDLTDGSFIMVWPDNTVDVGRSRAPDPDQSSLQQQTVLCTFIPFRTVNLRSGPGTEYERLAQAPGEEELSVIGQGTSTDFFVWWKVVWEGVTEDVYVRSDLGESDCDAVCGNDVCEYGETSGTCAADCASGTGGGGVSTTTVSTASIPNLTSSGQGCLVNNCSECYESVSCYPTCNDCTCSKNEFGCVTCFCTEPDSTSSSATAANTTTTTNTVAATGTGCDFSTCEDCIAAFPCWPGECTVTECSLNEFGCPACTTAP